ncbi:MAG: hypothetical protein JST93_27065 [Acidobacteria bacterium]|nr:hypothetical protein [Acidobacteriota bacterium]
MSYDLGIHAWYESAPDQRPALFARVAGSVPGSIGGRLRVADTDPSEIVLDVTVQQNEESIESALKPFVGEHFAYEFERTFECSVPSSTLDSTKQEPRPLTVYLCGSGYGVDGYYYKRNGLLRLSFSNVGVFGVPSRLFERVQMLPPGSVEQVQALKVIATISHNIDLIHEVASAIICRTDPIHLMVCTEWEVHPLTAHAVYHRDLAEFSVDLLRIVQLHEQGGLYLQTPEQTQKYSEPRRISQDYGYLRNPASRAELATRIESYAKAADACRETLPDQYIKEALLTSPRTDVRQLLRSLYIAADQGACGYLEHQFLDLATLFPASPSGYVQ